MSILYTEEQQQIQDAARRMLADGYSAERLRNLLEAPGRYDETHWQACREMGWTALAIPEAYDGLGLGLLELALVAEAGGRSLCGSPFLLSSYAAAQAILMAADAATKAEVLPLLASGEKIATIGFGRGNDALAILPPVTWSDGSISGTMPAVLAGAHADLAVVLAADGASPHLVLVELDASVGRDILNTYDNSRGVADLSFTSTPARLLGEADAVTTAWAVLERAAVVLAAEQTGGADACLELACAYANTRQAFGQPIGKFQAIKHKLAEIYVATEIARANCLEAALRHDRGLADFTPLAAAARVSACEAYDLAAREGTQVFGGIGATWESDMHLHMRRARSTAGTFGSRFVWQDRLISALESAI